MENLLNLIKELANSRDRRVRGAVANNKNTPVEILVELANDENEYVRANVATYY